MQDEQDTNFITKLHRGKLNIIPWPVIGSKEFYELFSAIQNCLDQQEVTHKSAGEFLQTLKTLMAKLKVSYYPLIVVRLFILSNRQMIGEHCHVGIQQQPNPEVCYITYWLFFLENLVAHRALQLLDMLPRAVSSGTTDADGPLMVCSSCLVYRVFTDHQLRTLTPMSQLMLQIQKCSSISLNTVASMLQIEKPSSIPCAKTGVDLLVGSMLLRMTGFLGSPDTLSSSQR